MRTRPVLLLCVCFAVVQHRAVTGTASVLYTPDDASGGCTERLANVSDVTGVAVDCSRGNFSAVPTNISSLSVVLDLKHNRLRSVNRDSFIGLVSLKVLNLSYNQISTIEHGSFTDLSELSELYLDHNGISLTAKNIFKGLSRLENLDLSFNRIAQIGASAFNGVGATLKQLGLGNNYLGRFFSFKKSYRAFQQVANLTHLDLSNNGIYDFRSDVFRFQSNVRSLSLAGNALRDSSLFIEVHDYSDSSELLHVQQASVFHSLASLKSVKLSHNRLKRCCVAFNGLTDLKYVDLQSNAISYLDPENITKVLPNLNEFYLRGNPFDCSCRAATFFRWLDDSPVISDYLNWTCQQPESVIGEKVNELEIRECVQESYAYKWYLVVICLVILTVIVVIVVLKWHWHIRYKFRHFFKDDDMNIELEERKYDAFVSYSSHDSDRVIRSLVPHLDSLQVKSCIAERDFIAGIPIAENIVASIEQSRQVILVISRNFLKSDWCKYELQMAEYKHFTTGEKYVIPILLEEIPVQMMPKSLRYLLATKTYLEWKDGEKEEGLFWRRLGKALKASKSRSQRQEQIPIKQTGDIEVDVVARSSLSPITSPTHRSDTDDDVDVEPEKQGDHETCVTLDNSLKETCTDDQAIDITAKGPHIDDDPSSECQTVCSDVYTENPVVEDVKLMTKARRRDLSTFFAGIVEKGRHVFFTTLFRFKYTKTSSFHHKAPPMSDSEATAEPFLPKVVKESYIEEHDHIACCQQEPIYQNSWFLYHATRIRTKEPLPPVPVEQDDTSLSISEPQTTVVHMAAIEQYQSPMPVYEEIPCHGYERSLVPYGENLKELQAVQQQPRLNVVTSSLATGIFDSEGGHLVIEGTGVRLFIPPGAIKDGAEQQVTISISSDECDKPTLAEGQARISPVIRCSPHGITFQKSVALSFPHTGETSKGKAIHPVITNTDRGQEAGYEDMRKDHGARAIVRKSDCVVFLDHFTGVTLVEESPCPDEGAKGGSGSDDSTDKPLYAIPFWTLTSSGDVVVRVRLCQKRDDAKQTAYGDEQACGGRPCDGPPVTLYVQVRNGTKARVQLVMDNVRPGWASVDGLEKVIDCRRIFTDDEVQQCSFLLERCSDGDGHNSNRFRCRLQFIPEGNEDAQTTYVSVLTDEPLPLSPKQDFAVRPKRPPCLPVGTRKELCRLLDPSNPLGNDWRMLSCELNLQLDSYDIQLFEEHSDKRSPTFQILTLFELDYGHLPQVQQLHALRKVLAEPPMGRPDASRLVENVISQHFAEDGATPSVAHDHDQHCDPAASNTMSRLTGDRYYSPYAAPCAVQPKIPTATNMRPDPLTTSSTANTSQLDDAPEETTLKKTHLPETDSDQACKQESQSTAVCTPLKVPDRNASLATSQVEDTPSHTGATASTKRMQVTKSDDELIIVEEERIRSEDDVELLSSEDSPNWTDDKKLKKKHDVVDTHTYGDLGKECLARSRTGMHPIEEESVSLLDETDA
ncbi:uncharacterized protein LOC144911149 [Branchiostoma floridae x Branchiostoma belcheri]